MPAAQSRPFFAPQVGAVSLTFDDGDPSQLARVIPRLDHYGFRGTFFLSPPALKDPSSVVAWQAAAAAGHEMGNHSWSHVCSTNFSNGDGLENWTLDQIEQDILRAQELLTRLFPHQQRWTYAYPCYQTDVGRGLRRQSYVPVVARHFLAGRGAGEGYFANHPLGVDLAKVWGTPVERLSGPEMIGIIEEQAGVAGKWVVLAFHTVQGYRLSVSGEDFETLLAHLDRNRSRFRIDTFGAVAAHIAARHNRTSATPDSRTPG